uniref:Uncharacterized protein n=1 Tax=Angiostrongylus cantonensis TaxID=6313 RepID=A0A0K0D463_ANGCA
MSSESPISLITTGPPSSSPPVPNLTSFCSDGSCEFSIFVGVSTIDVRRPFGSDEMFDGTVNFLRKKEYPHFVTSAPGVPAAMESFRREYKAFFLDKDGQLLHRGSSEIHRHVLRNVELKSFASAMDVSSALWSHERVDVIADGEIERCGWRRDRCSLGDACSLEMDEYAVLSFVRETGHAFTVKLYSVPCPVCSGFQPRALVASPGTKYKLRSAAKMRDVLQRLHVAFAHCGPSDFHELAVIEMFECILGVSSSKNNSFVADCLRLHTDCARSAGIAS